ncbi:MAG: hypothetical protein FWD86_00785 [Firmicutes bacterium]|nr:hypothetical protein [Bacillota bacterium]
MINLIDNERLIKKYEISESRVHSVSVVSTVIVTNRRIVEYGSGVNAGGAELESVKDFDIDGVCGFAAVVKKYKKILLIVLGALCLAAFVGLMSNFVYLSVKWENFVFYLFVLNLLPFPLGVLFIALGLKLRHLASLQIFFKHGINAGISTNSFGSRFVLTGFTDFLSRYTFGMKVAVFFYPKVLPGMADLIKELPSLVRNIQNENARESRTALPQATPSHPPQQNQQQSFHSPQNISDTQAINNTVNNKPLHSAQYNQQRNRQQHQHPNPPQQNQQQPFQSPQSQRRHGSDGNQNQ